MAQRLKRSDYLSIGLLALVAAGVWAASNFLNDRTNYYDNKSRNPVDTMQRAWGVPHGLKPGEIHMFDGVEFAWCPSGQLEFGSPIPPDEICKKVGCDPNNPNQFDGEYPPKQAPIDGFWMSRHEITRAEWRAVMGTAPWEEAPVQIEDNPDLPATYLTWPMVNEYLEKKSSATEKFYVAPLEAMWEYACKASSTTIFSFGDDLASLADYAWYGETPYHPPPIHPVGLKQPNAWGLYDMHGNVAEFCDQTWDAQNKAIRLADKTTQPARVSIRGGSASLPPTYLRSAQRVHIGTEERNMELGFRIVLPPQ